MARAPTPQPTPESGSIRNFHHLVLAPDGRSALVLSVGGVPYELRDLATGKQSGQLPLVRHPAPAWSPDGRLVAVPVGATVELWRASLKGRVRTLRAPCLDLQRAGFSRDGTLVAGLAGNRLFVWETDTGRLRGTTLLGSLCDELTVAPEGHFTGNGQVERGLVAVVQKEDGTQELLNPADFEQKYGWKNDPGKVHLLQPLPPPSSPLPGDPVGPLALVREPAALPGVQSWTVETVSARGLVLATAYRTDGKLLATAGWDGTVRLWDPAEGKLVRMLLGPPAKVLSWSPDGKFLATGGEEPHLWEVETGRLLRRLPRPAYSIRWSADGRTVALVDHGKVRFVEAATGKLLRTFDLPGYAVTFAWSPDGKTLAFALSPGKTIYLYDTATGKEVQKLEGSEETAVGLAWSPDGKRLASVTWSPERCFRVWEAATGKLQGRFPVENVWGMDRALAWSPDGKVLALGFNQGPHGLFDPETGRPIRPFPGHHEVWALAWSPDGKQVIMAGSHGVRLYQSETGKQEHLLEDLNGLRAIDSLAWSPDARWLALAYHDGAHGLRVEAATGRRHAAPSMEGWRGAAWSPDGKTLAVSELDGAVRLLDARTGRPLRPLEGKPDPERNRLLAWSADGQKLAVGGRQGLGVWSAEGKLLWQHDKHQDLGAIAWSPDGKLATTDSGEKAALRLWQVSDGSLLHEVPLLGGQRNRLAWSPDGKSLVAAQGPEGQCLIVDGATGAVRLRAPNPDGFFNLAGIDWSADGKSFQTLDRETRLLRFDATTGKQVWNVPVASLPGARHVAAWSPDGRVTARTDGWTVALCDPEGWPVGVLLPDDPFEQLAIGPDGHYRGGARVEHAVRMVVQKPDGTSETLTPREFEQKYGFKNDPDKVRLTDDMPVK